MNRNLIYFLKKIIIGKNINSLCNLFKDTYWLEKKMDTYKISKINYNSWKHVSKEIIDLYQKNSGTEFLESCLIEVIKKNKDAKISKEFYECDTCKKSIPCIIKEQHNCRIKEVTKKQVLRLNNIKKDRSQRAAMDSTARASNLNNIQEKREIFERKKSEININEEARNQEIEKIQIEVSSQLSTKGSNNEYLKFFEEYFKYKFVNKTSPPNEIKAEVSKLMEIAKSSNSTDDFIATFIEKPFKRSLLHRYTGRSSLKVLMENKYLLQLILLAIEAGTKFFEIVENRYSESNLNPQKEISYLFELPKGDNVYWIWESTISGNATYIFKNSLDRKSRKSRTKQNIIDYLLSTTDNKRMKLIRKEVKLDGVLSFNRIIHHDLNSFISWKSELQAWLE